MQRFLRWGPTIALLCLAALQLALLFLYVVPGPFTIDEVTYHRMTYWLANGHGLFLWNGYEELASPELVDLLVKVNGQTLTAPYPYGYPILAMPTYLLFGYRGLFLPNALAMIGCAALTYRIGLRFLFNRASALCASALFVGATYASEYGLAIWPHATALFFILAAFQASLCALSADRGSRNEWAWAALAGGLLGLGGTIRLDVYLAVPVVAAFFFFARPVRWRPLWAFIPALLPGMIANSIVNQIRWGTFLPVSYGAKIWNPAKFQIAAVGLVIAMAAWLVTRRSVWNWLSQKRRGLAIASLAIVVLIALPGSRAVLQESARGAFAVLVDARATPEESGAGLGRSDSGAMRFSVIPELVMFKRAMLQSCPFLVAALIPFLWALVRRKPQAWPPLLLLGAIPLSYAGFYAYGAWHGGVSINMRYLLPLLPFLCVLSAYALERLVAELPRLAVVLAAFAVLVTVIVYSFAAPPMDAPHTLDRFLCFSPLCLAGVALFALVLWALRPEAVTAGIAMMAISIAIGWSVAVSWHHDVRSMREVRAHQGRAGAELSQYIRDDSLIVLGAPHLFSSVIEQRHHLRMASPLVDGFNDVGKLVAYHQARNRRTYGLLLPENWEFIKQRFAFCGRYIATLGNGVLGEILPRAPGSPCPR